MASFADLIDMVDATAQSLLGGELIVTAATLIKVTPGTRGATVSAGTNPTTVSHSCEGSVQKFAADLIDGTLVRGEDRRISLLIATLPVAVEPKPNDKITIQGATYVVLQCDERDPASFMFTCHGRQ